MKKKDEKVILPISCSREFKESFLRVCKNQDTSASKEVRDFMRKFISQHGQQRLKGM